jgi:hypothetical protein
MLECARPVAHLAAEWADLDLIELLDLSGVDFGAIDHRGQSALYHIPLGASQMVVKTLVEMCKVSSPIADRSSRTPAEVLFRRVRLLPDEFLVALDGPMVTSCRLKLT